MFFKTKKKEKQKTFIYCPKCNTELIKNGLFIKDEDGVLEYGCPKCGTTSFWDFSFPAPYLRTCKDCMHIHDNDFGSPYCEKEVKKNVVHIHKKCLMCEDVNIAIPDFLLHMEEQTLKESLFNIQMN